MFSRDAKDEVAGFHEPRGCCATNFVQALSLFGVRRRGGRGLAIVASSSASVARAIISASGAIGMNTHAYRAPHATSGGRWVVAVPSLPAKVSRLRRLRRTCCRRALLRAAFLACGSVSDPARAYHVEFFCHSDDSARVVCETLASLGIDAGLTRRRRRPLVYVKDAQDVSTLLGHMGASRAVLRLESQRALRQTKNSIRRTVNSEAANAARAAVCAARQRDAALRVISTLGHSSLSRAVREAARLRIAFPSRTMRELARSARPPITKAAMANRLRLLERLGER